MQLGWDLHPAISFKNDSEIKIADHGCGNAYVYTLVYLAPANRLIRAWLLSLNAKSGINGLGNVTFVGFDLSPVHFPAPGNLPSNFKLGVLDAFSDNIPDKHIGQYDVVHVRVFTAVVKSNDPGPLIRNALKMLKPGGYFQWDEFDGASWKAVAPGDDSSIPTTATTAMLENFQESGRKAMNIEHLWEDNLGGIFQEHGFDLVEHKRMDVKMELRKPMSDSLLMAMHHAARIVVGADGCMVGTDRTWEELRTEAAREIERGVTITMDMMVTVGRKPE
jgi:SAM-dependent methyltransferase